MQGLSAATSVVAVVGDPIAHSLSPAIHNAGFAQAGLDWVCVALPVAAGQAAAAAAGIRALGLRGVSVTMPHKSDMVDQVDELTPVAAALSSVNCLIPEDGRLIGDNTDGAGFLAGLRDDFDWEPSGRSCMVIGAGGAARAVVLALAGAGASSVVVVNRSPERAQQAAALAGAVGSVGHGADLDGIDLVVNATPVGMGDSAALPLDPDGLTDAHVVAELVYHPAVTPLMAAASARGCRTSNGVSMLVHQAAVAFERWTGVDAPIDAMSAAARSAIAARTPG
ncbi:MAG: shikimate dehydrogenase [Microthrixaceae bacterium]